MTTGEPEEQPQAGQDGIDAVDFERELVKHHKDPSGMWVTVHARHSLALMFIARAIAGAGSEIAAAIRESRQ